MKTQGTQEEKLDQSLKKGFRELKQWRERHQGWRLEKMHLKCFTFDLEIVSGTFQYAELSETLLKLKM